MVDGVGGGVEGGDGNGDVCDGRGERWGMVVGGEVEGKEWDDEGGGEVEI